VNQEPRISAIAVEDEMRESYLSYAMSVIASRALPDVRDGLKPVQRRILYAMREMGMTPDKQHRKCAGVIGEVLKNYHPHGDSSVYDALVRMAQDFTLRYPLVDGHGNFGSIDGDPPAAYRYTEARLARIAMEMLADIDKDTVDFVPNFDNQGTEPVVLPGDRSMDCCTPRPARGFAPLVSAGQYSTQAVSQALIPPRSFSNRYSVRPRASTRIAPSVVFLSATTAPLGAYRRDADDVSPCAGATNSAAPPSAASAVTRAARPRRVDRVDDAQAPQAEHRHRGGRETGQDQVRIDAAQELQKAQDGQPGQQQ